MRDLSASVSSDPLDGSGAQRSETSCARILVVDDVADNRALLVRRFEKRNFEVVEVDCGAAALKLISSMAFDAILLDIMMPGMNGFEVLQKIREQQQFRALPVIMVTARTDSADVVKALELGADDFVTKPVDFGIAFARVKGHVERKRSIEKLEVANQALNLSNERLIKEIASRERSEERTHYLTHYDSLTGLGNHTLLEDRVSQAIAYAARYDRCFALAFIDLDNFKIINESLGHDAGDQLLRLIAGRMAECLRASDTVVRLGRDEFVVLLLDQDKDAQKISKVIEKLRAAISEKAVINGHDLSVTSSVGIASYPNDGINVQTLLTNAEAAAHRAKDIGRDNFQFYKPEFNTRAYERLLLLEEMRNALARSEFTLFYQPQVDLRSNRVMAVEALIRWRHPVRGMISPLNFIPAAEESGLIVPIGRWVVQEACRQNKAWQDRGLPPLTMCVNVSARQFLEGSLVGCVVDALKESGLRANFLELELTESLIMQDVEKSVETMKRLRNLGVHLSIDDFGTGYSSLAALKTFPIGRLKIDKTFLDDVAGSESDRAVVRAIIAMGQNLRLKVIAEGVETFDQVAFLRESNCDEMQGYHVSKPLDACALEQWFGNWLAAEGQAL